MVLSHIYDLFFLCLVGRMDSAFRIGELVVFRNYIPLNSLISSVYFPIQGGNILQFTVAPVMGSVYFPSTRWQHFAIHGCP